MLELSDSKRRGLRTAIDVLLSAATSGLLLVIYNALAEPDMTATAFAALFGTLTPVLSVIKNALEDKAGSSLLVSKQRPEPDPTTPDTPPSVVVGPQDGGTDFDLDQIVEPPSGPRAAHRVHGAGAFGVPAGMVLVAVPANEVQEDDIVLGVTQ